VSALGGPTSFYPGLTVQPVKSAFELAWDAALRHPVAA